MILLERRPPPSRAGTRLPDSRGGADDIFGAVMFAALGNGAAGGDPHDFLGSVFGEFAWLLPPPASGKGAPLVLIAIGLAFGFRAGIWNIGAEGQYIVGAMSARLWALPFTRLKAALIFPLMVSGRRLWRLDLGDDPRGFEGEIRHERDPCVAHAGLCGRAIAGLDGVGLLRNPEGIGFSGIAEPLAALGGASNPNLIAGSGMHWGVVAAVIAVIFAYVMLTRHRMGFQYPRRWRGPACGAFRGSGTARLVVFCLGFGVSPGCGLRMLGLAAQWQHRFRLGTASRRS